MNAEDLAETAYKLANDKNLAAGQVFEAVSELRASVTALASERDRLAAQVEAARLLLVDAEAEATHGGSASADYIDKRVREALAALGSAVPGADE